MGLRQRAGGCHLWCPALGWGSEKWGLVKGLGTEEERGKMVAPLYIKSLWLWEILTPGYCLAHFAPHLSTDSGLMKFSQPSQGASRGQDPKQASMRLRLWALLWFNVFVYWVSTLHGPSCAGVGGVVKDAWTCSF